jgi:hypothetical protein
LTGRSDAHSLRLVSTASRIARISGAFLVLALALVSHPACRSAGGRRPEAPSGPNTDAERALVGQQRLLRFYGKKKSVSVSLDKAGQGSGECDVAVEVKTAAFDVGKATFTLATIGQPRLEGRPRERPGKKSRCRKLPAQTSLVISGLESDSTDKLIAAVGEVLLTPEDYLRAHGTRFDRPPSADPKEVADPSPTGVLAEQRLAEGLTTRQRLLLSVDPVYRGPNRKVHYEGQIEVVTVVGADGRVHTPKLASSLGEHEQRVLQVLRLWRFEPAMRGGQPVAVRSRERTVLRID